jgi:uncharacterized membrane protein YhaH (DUF805 family)
MTRTQILFSFHGRIGRATFWGYYLLIYVTIWIAVGTIFALLLRHIPGANVSVTFVSSSVFLPQIELILETLVTAPITAKWPPPLPIVLLVAAINLGVLWPYSALQIKRFQDQNLPGWLVIIPFIPFLLSRVWQESSVPTLAGIIIGLALVWAVGFRRGTLGDNKYGIDPMAKTQPSKKKRHRSRSPQAVRQSTPGL